MSGDDTAVVRLTGSDPVTVTSVPADGVTIESVLVDLQERAAWVPDTEAGGLNGTVGFTGNAPRHLAIQANTSAGPFFLIVNSL